MKKIIVLIKVHIKLSLIYLKEVFFLFSHKKPIVHIGHYSHGRIMKGNVGDPILYKELECLYNKVTGRDNIWLHRTIVYEVSAFEVWLFNKFAKAIFVGGHGLLMVDTGKNQNSGWQFNIRISNLCKIKCPLVFLAIGYNTFRNQSNFIDIFNRHINLCVNKSVFFGLRNYGSIHALEPFLDEKNKSRILFQPCPTTMLSLYEELTPVFPQKTIAICLAFDRFKNRFGDSFDKIFSSLMCYADKWSKNKYKIIFFVHNPSDLQVDYCRKFADNGYPIENLSGLVFDDIFKFYRQKSLIVGMRGHSLMIPWGLRVPVISLTTQNKQKWFIETTGHIERSIEINNTNFLKCLDKETDYILSNYKSVIDDIVEKQNEFYEITKCNFLTIDHELS